MFDDKELENAIREEEETIKNPPIPLQIWMKERERGVPFTKEERRKEIERLFKLEKKSN